MSEIAEFAFNLRAGRTPPQAYSALTATCERARNIGKIRSLGTIVGANPSFSAAASAAGYYYQARLALAEALRFAYSESGIEIAIERLDDVSFEKNGQALELLQTKHHVSKTGDLTDASLDIWKTLRIWSRRFKSEVQQCSIDGMAE